ncbi:MAG TPA: glycoside hydrolase family 3 N-terminal domain-containing protein, partial [Pseudomonadales bacterium]|nr:glycoside hydrolase family 3 N-terminal domain-containing protein [Pseudomonadales bacterium]
MKTLRIDGATFRDLDHDGVLAPYEDHRLSADVRARDLLARMTLAEKAGTMMHGTARSHGALAALGVGAGYDLAPNERLIARDGINHLITRLDAAPAEFAAQNNALQELAAATRLGIPLTISTDPRHHFQHVTGASSRAKGFSQWPETTGLAAIGSAEVVERFAAIARDEYRAVGIHMALSPQADISTEPRWARVAGTFGEDPQRARRLVEAYVKGMQGGASGVRPDGVACVVKHWVGYGAAPDGFDGHNAYGRFCAVTAESLPLHVEPFLGAFAAGVAGVMPTYTIPRALTLDGAPVEAVGGGFNRQLLEDLLRGVHRFDGFVLSDWAIYLDATAQTFAPDRPQAPRDIAMPWGVESLTRAQRFAKSVTAGVDQLGGEEDVATLIGAVEQGLIPLARIDAAVFRLLVVKFRQGLFDAPFVDAQAAAERVGTSAGVEAGRAAQRRSLVCLKQPTALRGARRVHLVHFDTAGAPLDAADAAVIRLSTPHQTLHPNH